MSTLYNNGIFNYDTEREMYANNATSTLLLAKHWTQWHNWVDLYGNEFYDMARGIPKACKEDATRFPGQIEYDTDKDMFTWFQEHGLIPRMHATLGGGAIAQAPGILADYPWSEVADSTVLDVGGGGGGLVALLLRAFPTMKAGILDMQRVIDHAAINFHTPDGMYADVGDRVLKNDLVVGNFLEKIPRYEVYTMKWCLHDWNDADVTKILKNIRAAILLGEKSRLVVLESLLADGRMQRLSRYADMTMNVSTHNGQERGEAQWRRLAKDSGWVVKKIYILRNAWPCAIEMIPV
jgi:hypothetical protein